KKGKQQRCSKDRKGPQKEEDNQKPENKIKNGSRNPFYRHCHQKHLKVKKKKFKSYVDSKERKNQSCHSSFQNSHTSLHSITLASHTLPSSLHLAFSQSAYQYLLIANDMTKKNLECTLPKCLEHGKSDED
ncbi:hypothetical protein, partial [[Clostridium] innocuum]|uniref:hypothetical protein n=1 Tax=Clostridium innocuum TaxID=1522 RepID=UPI0005D2C8FB